LGALNTVLRNKEERPSSGTRSRPVVLVVDDDLDARLIYRRYLTVKGCHVYTARDGSIGVQIAKRRRPDLIVMDLAMPRLNGWAATAELKESPLTRGIPILILSAVPASPHEARAAGCAGFLAKPCLPELLWLEIQPLLRPESFNRTH
jgi:CheY-like chemotaxis protein